MQNETAVILQAIEQLAQKQEQQAKTLEFVCQELATIKADVIIIKGVALSDFAMLNSLKSLAKK